MAETEEVVQEEGLAGVLGMEAKVEDDESMSSERSTLTELPEEMAALEPDAVVETEAEEAPERSNLDIVHERLNPKQVTDNALEREIADLKAQQNQTNDRYMSKIDQLLEGPKEPEPVKASPVDEFTTPAIAKMLAEAADNPEEQLRLLNTLSNEIADRKIETRLKPLEERLQQREATDVQRADQDGRMVEIARAVETLAQRGGTAAALVEDFKTNKKDSYLMKYWLGIPGVTLSHQNMVASVVGFVPLVDDAAQNGTATAPKSLAVTEAPRPVTSDTATTKPRASKRGAELTQPQPTKDPAENVLANLRAAIGSGGGLNDW